MHMPRSQFPVVSPTLAVTRWRLMPSSKSKLSAFPATTAGYRYFPYRPQIYNFRKSVTRPTHSLHLASYTPYWICTQVHYWQVWPILSGGNWAISALTHWVIQTTTRPYGLFQSSGFNLTRGIFCYILSSGNTSNLSLRQTLMTWIELFSLK